MNKENGMKLVKSAVILAVFALAPFVALAEEAKAPANPSKCPYVKAQQAAGDQVQGCCPAKAAEVADKSGCCAKDGDKAACSKDAAACSKDKAACSKDAVACNKDKAACSQPAKEGCAAKDGQQADAGSCCKAKQPVASAAK
jgi:hypothetical protein